MASQCCTRLALAFARKPNYVLQRTPGTSLVSTEHCGPAPLNTALGCSPELSRGARTLRWSEHGHLRIGSFVRLRDLPGLHRGHNQLPLGRRRLVASYIASCCGVGTRRIVVLLGRLPGALPHCHPHERLALRRRCRELLGNDYVPVPQLPRGHLIARITRRIFPGCYSLPATSNLTVCCSGRRGRRTFQPTSAARRR